MGFRQKKTDMLFLVGPNTLDANSRIDNEVIKTIKKGNMSSLNCPEEVLLVKIHLNTSMPTK